jgi:hypothetical protein
MLIKNIKHNLLASIRYSNPHFYKSILKEKIYISGVYRSIHNINDKSYVVSSLSLSNKLNREQYYIYLLKPEYNI